MGLCEGCEGDRHMVTEEVDGPGLAANGQPYQQMLGGSGTLKRWEEGLRWACGASQVFIGSVPLVCLTTIHESSAAFTGP